MKKLIYLLLSCAAPLAALCVHTYPTNPAPEKAAFFGQLNRDSLVVTNFEGSAGGGISTQQATNIAASVVTNDVATWALAGHDEPVTDLTPAMEYTTAVSNKIETAVEQKADASGVYTKADADNKFINKETSDVQSVNGPLNLESPYNNHINGSLGWGTGGMQSMSYDDENRRMKFKWFDENDNLHDDNFAYTKDIDPVSNRVDYLDGYIAGQRVRVSVTNYYGNTSGELPRLRIEEFVTATNVVDGVATETNYWQIVWDEQNKYDRFMSEAKTAISAMTNSLYQTYYALLQERLATKAPRAWGTLTSAGEAAPPGSVWHTEPNTVFAGGTEYAHAMVGTGVIGVLSSKGAAVYTDGETGRFHFTTDDKTAYFGMNIASRYELGCATDGITVTPVGGNNMVDLLYNVTMSGKPVLYYTPTLQGNVTWEQITDSSGGSIPGATVYASWDQSPPAGSEICTINCGASLSGFFKASVEYAGVSKFETNMMADLAGGIVATNVTNGQCQPIEAIITNGIPVWRVKQ